MKCTIYVDGSYMEQNGKAVYGGGLYLESDKLSEPVEYCFGGSDPNYLTMRNVAGEVLAALHAMALVREVGMWDEVDLIYDYIGVENWVTGKWKANKAATQFYRDSMRDYLKKFKVNFIKVDGHTGVFGNEMADRLAKEGCRKVLI